MFQKPFHPEHHSPDKQTQTIAQHFTGGDFLHISITVWKPFSLQQPSKWLLSFNGVMKTEIIPDLLLLPVSLPDGQRWMFFPSYLVGPSTEAIIPMRNQVLSPAQKFIFPLFCSKNAGLQGCLLRQQVQALIKLI